MHENDGLSGGEVVGEEVEECCGESGVVEFREEKLSFDVVKCTFYVGEKHANFVAVSEFVDPCVE